MNLTFSTLASPAWTLDQIIQHAHAAGMNGVDLRGIGPQIDITLLPAFTTELSATLQRLESHGLAMPCLNSSITLVTPDPTKWEAMLGEARRYAELARQSKTPFVRVFGGSIPQGMTRTQARDLGRAHLGQIVEIGRSHGMKPLLETHDSWVLSEQVLELVGDFNADEAGVLWDLEHPFRGGESPAKTAAMLASRIKHVHIKDTIRVDGVSVPKLLGEGELPLAECFAALKKIHYTGWICLETEKRWHPQGPEPEISISQFAEYMRNRAE